MEPRIQYAKTEDSVSVAYWTPGEGKPLVSTSGLRWGNVQIDWQNLAEQGILTQLANGRKLIQHDARRSGLSDRNAGNVSLESVLLDLETAAPTLCLMLALEANG